MKKNVITFAVVSTLALGTIGMVGCGGQQNASNPADTAETTEATANTDTASYEIDYGTSEIYTQADIDAAISTVMAEFDKWTGCTMKRIAYAGDQTSQENIAYANELREAQTPDAPEYNQVIVLISDYHSPSAEQAEGTAWEPDHDYNDYSWILARTDSGAWQLLTWGYA